MGLKRRYDDIPPLTTGLAGILFALLAGSANAQDTPGSQGDFFIGPNGVPCSKTVDLMAHRLEVDFHELAIGIGWTSTVNHGIAGVTQLFASKAGTWTLIRTIANGETCITSSGEGWDRINVELPDPTRKMM